MKGREKMFEIILFIFFAISFFGGILVGVVLMDLFNDKFNKNDKK